MAASSLSTPPTAPQPIAVLRIREEQQSDYKAEHWNRRMEYILVKVKEKKQRYSHWNFETVHKMS